MVILRARGPESQDPVLKKLAVKYDVTLTRIVLGWGLSRGVGLATQSKSELHRKQTLNVRFLCCSVPSRRAEEFSVASRVGPGGREGDHSPRSKAVCLRPARQVWNPFGMDPGAVRL